MNARTKLAIEDAVDVRCGQFGVISQQVVYGLFYLCKTSGGILEQENFFDTEEHTHEEWIRVTVCCHRRVQSLYSWLEAEQHALRQ